MNLGNTIKILRKQKKIKQFELASKADISQTYLSQIENNVKKANNSTLEVIARVLGTPLPVLYFLAADEDDIEPGKRESFKQVSPMIKTLLNNFS